MEADQLLTDYLQARMEPRSQHSSLSNKLVVVFAVSVLLTAITSGSIVYFWQNSVNGKEINNLRQKIAALEEEISKIKTAEVISQPTLPPVTSPTPTVESLANLRTYSTSLFTFRYPSNWRVFPQRVYVNVPEENQPYFYDDNCKLIGGITVYEKGHKFKIDSPTPEDPSLEKYMRWNRYIRDDLPDQRCIEATYGILSGYHCSLNPYGRKSFNFISKTNQRFVIVEGEADSSQEFIKILSTFKFKE